MASKICLLLCFSVVFITACKKSHAGAPEQKNPDFRTVGYLMIDRDDAVAAASAINFSAITHLNLAFINPNPAGDFDADDNLSQIIAIAHNNHVKVLMSIGGGGIPPYFTKFLTNEKMPGFISRIIDEVAKYDFDGVDVDLEGDAVNSNYSKFVTGLAAGLTPQNKLITAAVATWFGANVTDSALAIFDFINIMSYDKTGPWAPAKAGQHAPYGMAVSDIQYWGATRAVPKEKMTLGLPFYGYGFGPGNTTSTMHYGDIVRKYPGAENKDEIKLQNGQTMYYNGIPTIENKTKLALQQTGGVMVWELTQDATGNLSLLKNIHDVITGN